MSESNPKGAALLDEELARAEAAREAAWKVYWARIQDVKAVHAKIIAARMEDKS